MSHQDEKHPPAPAVDALLARLAELPTVPPDDLQRARVRRVTLAALAEERRLAGRPMVRVATRAWSGAILPVLLAGTVGVYLVWAVRFSAALYR